MLAQTEPVKLAVPQDSTAALAIAISLPQGDTALSSFTRTHPESRHFHIQVAPPPHLTITSQLSVCIHSLRYIRFMEKTYVLVEHNRYVCLHLEEISMLSKWTSKCCRISVFLPSFIFFLFRHSLNLLGSTVYCSNIPKRSKITLVFRFVCSAITEIHNCYHDVLCFLPERRASSIKKKWKSPRKYCQNILSSSRRGKSRQLVPAQRWDMKAPERRLLPSRSAPSGWDARTQRALFWIRALLITEQPADREGGREGGTESLGWQWEGQERTIASSSSRAPISDCRAPLFILPSLPAPQQLLRVYCGGERLLWWLKLRDQCVFLEQSHPLYRLSTFTLHLPDPHSSSALCKSPSQLFRFYSSIFFSSPSQSPLSILESCCHSSLFGPVFQFTFNWLGVTCRSALSLKSKGLPERNFVEQIFDYKTIRMYLSSAAILV